MCSTFLIFVLLLLLLLLCARSHRNGARIVFYRGAEFLDNVSTGYGGAILNHGELDFDCSDDDRDDDDSSADEQEGEGEEGGGEEEGRGGGGEEVPSYTLKFDGNYCGEQEVSQERDQGNFCSVGCAGFFWCRDICRWGVREPWPMHRLSAGLYLRRSKSIVNANATRARSKSELHNWGTYAVEESKACKEKGRKNKRGRIDSRKEANKSRTWKEHGTHLCSGNRSDY